MPTKKKVKSTTGTESVAAPSKAAAKKPSTTPAKAPAKPAKATPAVGAPAKAKAKPGADKATVPPPAPPASDERSAKGAAKPVAGDLAAKPGGKKPAAGKAPAAAAAKPAPKEKPAFSKAPGKPRYAALDSMDGPDDDDLEGEDEGAAEKKTGGDEEEEGGGLLEPAVAVATEPPKPRVRRPIPSLPPRKPGVITVAFSPDADDAFMLYGLVNGKVDTETRKYEWIRADIAGLNAEANKGTYDVTAFSFGAWPEVSDRYLVLPCGGSFGDQVGPVVVAKTPVRSGEVSGLVVAVPGKTTTAALVLRLWLHPNRITLVEVPFQQVGVALKAGKARAGVLIHEGQLTYKADGLVRVMDLGQWWGEKTEGLPLPLGGMAMRRDIPTEERAKVALDLKRSIAYALGHREEALDYAMPFGRGLSRALLDKYVSMYVNELTLDYGERGRQAVHTLYDEAVRHGLLAERVDLDFA
jgi:1,4-dihydroxy-6-naphthoate synthase